MRLAKQQCHRAEEYFKENNAVIFAIGSTVTATTISGTASHSVQIKAQSNGDVS